MHAQAHAFGLPQLAEELLTIRSPKLLKATMTKHRKIRQMKNAGHPLSIRWKAQRLSIMRAIVKRKFLGNPDARRALVATGSRLLAEASPYDTFWGVGMSASDPRIFNGPTAEGWMRPNKEGQLPKNHMGRILMGIRDDLQKEK